MSESSVANHPLVEKVQKFIKLTFLIMALALLVGGVGAWFVYENHSAGTIYRIELLIPVIVATCVAGVGLRIYRGKLFNSKEEFKQATELFKQKMEQKNKPKV